MLTESFSFCELNQKIHSRSNWKEWCFLPAAQAVKTTLMVHLHLECSTPSSFYLFIYHRSPESKWGQLWRSLLLSLQVFVSVYVFLYKPLPSFHPADIILTPALPWNTQPRLYRSELICLDWSDFVPKPFTWSCRCFGCSRHDVIHERQLAITTRNDWPDLVFTFKTNTASIPHLTSETNPVILFHYLL